MKSKSLFLGLFFSIFCLMSSSCQSRSKSMDVLNGKEGIFAVIDVTKGTIVVELFYDKVPLTVTNFVGLAEGTLDAAKGKKFYDGLKFHRVISKKNGDDQDFMIQGGDPQGNGTGGPGYKFEDEFVDDLDFSEPFMLAMANSGTNTNGSQFFITIVPTEWLTGKHTIFGKVISGQDVVNNTLQNDVIKSVKIVRQGKDAEKFTATQNDFNSIQKNLKVLQQEAKEKAMANLVKGCTKTEDGIYYQILEEGKGSAVGKGKKVTVEYKGYLTNGSLFDASKGFHPQGHEPLSFSTGAGDMIPGFDEMVQQMKLGETRKMILPPEKAYVPNGIQGVIPGNSYICFDVKLIKF